MSSTRLAIIYQHNDQNSILAVQAILTFEIATMIISHQKGEILNFSQIDDRNNVRLMLIGVDFDSLQGFTEFNQVIIIGKSKNNVERLENIPPNLFLYEDSQLSVGQNMVVFICSRYRITEPPRCFWIIDHVADKTAKRIPESEFTNASLEKYGVVDRIHDFFTANTIADPLIGDYLDLHYMFGKDHIFFRRKDVDREIKKACFSPINFRGLVRNVWISTSIVHHDEIANELLASKNADFVCFCDFNIADETWSVKLIGDDASEIAKWIYVDSVSNTFNLSWIEFDRIFSRKPTKDVPFFAVTK